MPDLQTRSPFKYLPGLTLLVGAALSIFILVSYRGTYDSGDSVGHYLIAHFSFKHPELFLDHWGKPFFTLLASIPAQWGFFGMKVFNMLAILAAALSTAAIAKRLTPQVAPFATLFVFAAPQIFAAQFSGLTEPLFAAVLGISLLLTLKEKYLPAFLLMSFLPFVRSEGFLLLPVMALFALEKWFTARRQVGSSSPLRNFSFPRLLMLMSLLAAGTVLYSLIGAYFKGDLLWVFSQNPYQSHLDNYGIGNWTHFTKGYIFILGVPLYGLWILGMVAALFASLQYISPERTLPHPFKILVGKSAEWRLVNGLFLAYFGAHTVFWATGMAHSMGLLRVLIALAPVGALLCLRGFQALSAPLRRWPVVWIAFCAALGLYILVFPFTANPAGLKWRDFNLTEDQKMLREMWSDHYALFPLENGLVYSSHPYAPIVFLGDPYEDVKDLSGVAVEELPENTLIVWDSWFALVESGFPEEYWAEHEDIFELIDTYEGRSKDDVPIKMMLLRVRPTISTN